MGGERDEKVEPKVPTERPDPKAAERRPDPDARDRPGFDLGGATEEQPSGPTAGNVRPRGPADDPAPGGTATGRASGATDVSGSRSLGQGGEPGSESGSGPTDGTGGAH